LTFFTEGNIYINPDNLDKIFWKTDITKIPEETCASLLGEISSSFNTIKPIPDFLKSFLINEDIGRSLIWRSQTNFPEEPSNLKVRFFYNKDSLESINFISHIETL